MYTRNITELYAFIKKKVSAFNYIYFFGHTWIQIIATKFAKLMNGNQTKRKIIANSIKSTHTAFSVYNHKSSALFRCHHCRREKTKNPDRMMLIAEARRTAERLMWRRWRRRLMLNIDSEFVIPQQTRKHTHTHQTVSGLASSIMGVDVLEKDYLTRNVQKWPIHKVCDGDKSFVILFKWHNLQI